jgi:hypothetical protein
LSSALSTINRPSLHFSPTITTPCRLHLVVSYLKLVARKEKKLLKFPIVDRRLADTLQAFMFELRVVTKRNLGNTITSITAAVNTTTIQVRNQSLAISFHLPILHMVCLKGIIRRRAHRDNTVMTLAIHHQTKSQAKGEIARGISGQGPDLQKKI